jgi:hypothetical protein
VANPVTFREEVWKLDSYKRPHSSARHCIGSIASFVT